MDFQKKTVVTLGKTALKDHNQEAKLGFIDFIIVAFVGSVSFLVLFIILAEFGVGDTLAFVTSAASTFLFIRWILGRGDRN